MNELRDVKAPVYFPPNYWLWIITGILVLIVAGIFLFNYFKNKKRLNQPAVLPLDPWDWAYEELKRLEHEGLLGRQKFVEYFVKLSDIARRYLEGRFSLRAPEMTTEEFLISLKQTQHLNQSQKESLKEFLTLCDLVKFAKFEPQMKDGEKGFYLVKQLVDDTKNR